MLAIATSTTQKRIAARQAATLCTQLRSYRFSFANAQSLLVRDKEVEAERKRRQRAATIMHSFDVESPRSARSDETRGVDQRMAVLEEATDSEEEYDGPSIEARHVAEP
eukprot:COSAG01_NODE_8594_length_2725_cov_1.947829_1_plen_109_part_00